MRAKREVGTSSEIEENFMDHFFDNSEFRAPSSELETDFMYPSLANSELRVEPKYNPTQPLRTLKRRNLFA